MVIILGGRHDKDRDDEYGGDYPQHKTQVVEMTISTSILILHTTAKFFGREPTILFSRFGFFKLLYG